MTFQPERELRRSRALARQRKLYHWRRDVISDIQRSGIRRFYLSPPASSFDAYMIPRNRWYEV